MNFFENVVSAFQNVRGNKMRSILTMLGIIIGIGSVIIILSLGAGVKGAMMSTLDSINKNMIQVMNWRVSSWEDMMSLEDVENIKELENVDNATSVVQRGGQRVKLRMDNEYKSGEISGIDENYRIIENLVIKFGRFFSKNDMDNKMPIAIVTEKRAMEVFGYTDCIGEKIEFESYNGTNSFTIVGVLEMEPDALGITSMPSTSSLLLVPITTMQEITYNDDKVDYLGVTVKDTAEGVSTAKRITDFLEVKHNNKEGYYAESLSSNIEQVSTVLNIITGFVAFVAFISLFVGGVGVMNIMLVTVTERTREIGIRKSLGATDGNIKLLFVMEALILTSFGGLVGILFGNFVSEAVCSVITGMMGVLVSPSISTLYIGIAFGVSSLVGIVFGVYPASKAAKLDPIEALRYE